jgi:hypothetical protein
MKQSHDIHRLKWLSLLVCVPLLAGAVHVHLPSLWGGFLGDSAVYYAMADSLAHDYDLQYTRTDLIRITAEWPDGPLGILLVADRDDPSIIHYAKPIIYSLAGAPFVRLLQSNGLLILNTICFAALIVMGCLAFPAAEKKHPVNIVLWTLVFWGVSAVPAYVFSLTPDLFNGTLLFAGLIPWIRHKSSRKPVGSLFVSIIILCIAAVSRPPNALFLVLPFWSLAFETTNQLEPLRVKTIGLWLKQRLPLLAGALIAVAAGFGLMLLLSHILTGQGFAYSGFRKRIVTPFPFQAPDITFLNSGGDVISTETTKFVFNWHTIIYNIYYFFVGRFAGMIPWFFPAFAALSIAFYTLFESKTGQTQATPSRLPLWLVLAGLYVFHIVYIPANWHGGSCAIGNRYLIAWLPGFFILLKKPPGYRVTIVTAAVAALFTGIITMSPATAFANYRDLSKRDILKLFPMEITLLEAWPVDNEHTHRRVVFDDYFLYFSDDNHFGKENGGFWIRGKKTADLVLRCWDPSANIRLKIRNGGRDARIRGRVGKARFSSHFSGSETVVYDLDPGRPVRAYNPAGNVSYCYTVRISVSNGFIPRFSEPGSLDHRFLGCYVELETIP